MIGAIDDILFHVPRIRAVLRMLIVGAIGFVAAELLYGSRGSDSGVIQFILYGLVGFAPATLSSWLAHRYVDEPVPAGGAAERSFEAPSAPPTGRGKMARRGKKSLKPRGKNL